MKPARILNALAIGWVVLIAALLGLGAALMGFDAFLSQLKSAPPIEVISWALPFFPAVVLFLIADMLRERKQGK